MPSTDLAAFRALFPALAHTHWLATPGVPPAARPIADAVRHAVDAWEDGSFSWLGWEAEADETRALFARLVGVEPSTVALATTLSEAAALVASSVRGGRVVVHEREFRSNLYPWLALAGRGVEVDAVPPPLTTDALCSRITPGTTLVAVSAVQSATGVRVRLEEVAARCREVGARLFVNGTQALGALRLDLDAIRPDYLAAHGYKWLLAPRGAAWLHVRPDRLDELEPLEPSWKSSPAPLADYYGPPYELHADARRLDVSLAWLSWVGARAALELLLSYDAAAIEARCLGLARAFREGAAARGLDLVPGEEPSQIVSVPVGDAVAVAERLAAQRVAAGARDGAVRLGFHAFNDESDVAAALDALAPA